MKKKLVFILTLCLMLVFSPLLSASDVSDILDEQGVSRLTGLGEVQYDSTSEEINCQRTDSQGCYITSSYVPDSVDYLDSYNYSVDVFADQQFYLTVYEPTKGTVDLESVTYNDVDITDTLTSVEKETRSGASIFNIDLGEEYDDLLTFNFSATTNDDSYTYGINYDENGNYNYYIYSFITNDISTEADEAYISDKLNINFDDIVVAVSAEPYTVAEDDLTFTANIQITNIGETSIYVPDMYWYASGYNVEFMDEYYINGLDLDTYVEKILRGEQDIFLKTGESVTISYPAKVVEAIPDMDSSIALIMDSATNNIGDITSFTDVVGGTVIDYESQEDETSTDSSTTEETDQEDTQEAEILETGLNNYTLVIFALIIIIIVVVIVKKRKK